MTTDLRAALRAAADMLARVKPIDLNVGDDPHGLADRCRALADAPPTVAELLPLVDATHEVRWTDADGDEACATTEGEACNDASIFSFRRRPGWTGMDHEGWRESRVTRRDPTQPARLVEVTP